MAGWDSQQSPASEPLLLGMEVSSLVVVVGGHLLCTQPYQLAV